MDFDGYEDSLNELNCRIKELEAFKINEMSELFRHYMDSKSLMDVTELNKTQKIVCDKYDAPRNELIKIRNKLIEYETKKKILSENNRIVRKIERQQAKLVKKI